MDPRPWVLLIHALDSARDEGIVADSMACAELQCRPCHVATAVLAGSQARGTVLEGLAPALVADQLDAVLAQGRPAALRTGLLSDPSQVEQIAAALREHALPNAVVAPVQRIGAERILADETRDAMRQSLFPLARVVVIRAAELDGVEGRKARDLEGLKQAAAEVRRQGATAVLIAGALLQERVIDLLDDAGHVSVFDRSRLALPRVAGVARVHPAALAAFLGRGATLIQAVDAAQRYIASRLQRGH